jgi:hypothetical protein
MDTCSGDDVSYQIPIATTVTFDGVEYSNIYATTNSVITFGQPDGTYWAYPNTPSISLYSMDWFPGVSNTEGLDIYYSEGGFQINLNMVPYGNYGATPSTVNILVAITNTGGIAVSYSYQGPEYNNLRTGVRLHDGSIISLEAWGATQVVAGEEIPTLAPEPLPEPSPTPTGPTQEELVAQEEARVVNNLLAAAAGVVEVIAIEPDPIITPEPEPTPTETPLPEPDIIVEPEIITPEDPEFPENVDEPTQPNETNQEQDSQTNGEQTDTPVDEPSNEPQQEDTELPATDESEDPQPTEDPVQIPDNKPSNDDSISGANLLADLSSKDSFLKMTEDEKENIADSLGISVSDIATLAEAIQNNPELATAIEEFNDRITNNDNNLLAYTLADATTEVQTEAFLSDPLGAVLSVDVTELLSNFSELGMDMTDDQREKAQEVIVPVIIASQIAGAVMRRTK